MLLRNVCVTAQKTGFFNTRGVADRQLICYEDREIRSGTEMNSAVSSCPLSVALVRRIPFLCIRQ
jgi:hypothetical protein